jgi:hypothetical protein
MKGVFVAPPNTDKASQKVFVLMANAGLRYEFPPRNDETNARKEKIPYAQLLRLSDPHRQGRPRVQFTRESQVESEVRSPN